MSSLGQYVRGSDMVDATSVGTATTKTKLNGGVDLTTPNEAKNLIGIIPGHGATAALTAAESALIKFEVESKAVKDIMPKAIVTTATHGGLGAFLIGLAPPLRSYPFNTPLSGNEDISYYGTALVNNTAAIDAFAQVMYSNKSPRGNDPHIYWDGPTDETSTGTAAANGIAGGTFTLNAPIQSILRYLYTVLGVGTVTASESYFGHGEIRSADLNTSMPVKGLAQTIATAPGTAIGVGQSESLVHDEWIPMKPTARLATYYNQMEALTAAGNFYVGVGFIRI